LFIGHVVTYRVEPLCYDLSFLGDRFLYIVFSEYNNRGIEYNNRGVEIFFGNFMT